MKKIILISIAIVSIMFLPNFIGQAKALSNTKGDSFPDLPDTNENYIIFKAFYGGSGQTFLYTFNGNINTKLTISTHGTELYNYLSIINDTNVNVYYQIGTKWQLIKTTKNYEIQLSSNKIYLRNFDLSYNVTDYNNNNRNLFYWDGSVISTNPQEKKLLDGTTFIVPKASVEGYDKLYITKNTSQNKIYIKYFKNDTEDFYKTTNDNDLNGTYNISPKADYYHIEYDITKKEWSSGGSNLGMWNNYLNWWEHVISSQSSTITLTEPYELLYTDIRLLSNDKQTIIIDNSKPTPKINFEQRNTEGITYVGIGFSIFDTSKYKYEYSLYNANSWTEITNSYFAKKVYYDGQIFARITDRATGEVIASDNYIMTGVISPVINGKTYKYFEKIDIRDFIKYGKEKFTIRYYGGNPSEFFITAYELNELPSGVNCIVGTGIYECNTAQLYGITGKFGYYNWTGEYKSSYTEYQTNTYQNYYYEFVEDFSKYAEKFYCEDNSYDCWKNNYYREFELDLSSYILQPPQNKTDYIYVYYNVDYIYDKNLSDGVITDLPDMPTEDNKPPTYIEDNDILGNIVDGITDTKNKLLDPFINLINNRLPIIGQLGDILGSFKYDKTNRPKPSLTIDFSFLGGTQYNLFSDEFLNAYEQYRPILNFFIYLGISLLTIPKTIGYVRSYFGGGN